MRWSFEKLPKTLTVLYTLVPLSLPHYILSPAAFLNNDQIFLESHSAGQRSSLFSKTSCTVTHILANSYTGGMSFSVSNSCLSQMVSHLLRHKKSQKYLRTRFLLMNDAKMYVAYTIDIPYFFIFLDFDFMSSWLYVDLFDPILIYSCFDLKCPIFYQTCPPTISS